MEYLHCLAIGPVGREERCTYDKTTNMNKQQENGECRDEVPLLIHLVEHGKLKNWTQVEHMHQYELIHLP